MSVNTPSKNYLAHQSKWARCRDAFDGSDAIKAKREKYLPPIDMHKNDAAKYDAYLSRAYFFPAMARTVLGLVGAVFQKPPTFELPSPEVEEHAKDITGSGESLELFAYETLREDLIAGGYGILVDVSREETALERPYLIRYRREDILSIKRERRGADEIVTRVVLAETEDIEDGFVTECQPRFRVLELGDSIRDDEGTIQQFVNGNGEPVYVSTIWRQDENDESKFVADEPLFPKRGGENLTLIPFVVPDEKKPPLLDMVDVNLSHYRNSADYEHGLHFCGIPIPWVSTDLLDESGEVKVGPGGLLIVPDGTFNIAQADGDMMGALALQMERKEKAMAALGARMLEDQAREAETATAVVRRHAGEHASLRTEAGGVESDLATALRIHGWWASRRDFEDIEATVELNKDFMPEPMSPQKLQQLMMSYMGGGMSFQTLYYNFQQGEIARPGVTWEEELAELQRSEPSAPNVADTGMERDDE